ncbi:MAG: hypothetical protein J6O04_08450 [Selenomonadaceae bacterium]|nr:hypothetical protein [Selenomonadaceae bacterium]
MAKKDLYVDSENFPRNKEDFHPDDTNHSWDYKKCPEPSKYYQKYGNLDLYDKDNEKWEDEQRAKHK